MTRFLALALLAVALAGCAATGSQPVVTAVTPEPLRVPTECRVASKPFVRIREAGRYGPTDLATDFRRGKALYRSEAARADRCRLWVNRAHPIDQGARR